jgi:Pyridine nucleotide-disulphide oxidoreductase
MDGASGAEQVETVIIGGGQAGLSVGYHLARRGRRFVILDANQRIGDAWRVRWNSLRLFTPARYNGLPGWPFPAPAWSFPAKDEMAGYLEAYAARFELPVRTGVRVDRLSREGDRYVVAAGKHRYEADHVVVAAGAYQRPRIPAFAAELDPGIVQLHSSQYRDPSQLQEGGVLVVGAANSGAEIALELSRTHRTWLSGRHPGQEPFRPGSRWFRLFVPVIWFMAHPGADREDADGEDGSAEVPHWRRAPCPRPPARPHPAQGPHRRRDRAGAEDGGEAGRPAGAGGWTGPGGRERDLVHRVRAGLRLDRPSGLRPGWRPGA